MASKSKEQSRPAGGAPGGGAKRRRWYRRLTTLTAALFVVEFLDEMAFTGLSAAWPAVRDDLGLSYTELGLMMTVAGVVANVLEPVLYVFSDSRRRLVLLGGGVVMAAAFGAMAASAGFWSLGVAFWLVYPASGAFVGLSQSELVERADDVRGRERAMVWWTVAGCVGVVVGPLAYAGAELVYGGWRTMLVGCAAGFAVATVWVGLTFAPRASEGEDDKGRTLLATLAALGQILRKRATWYWLVLLLLSDLVLDVLGSLLALFVVDERSWSAEQAALGVVVWALAMTVGEVAMQPLLRRFDGLVIVLVKSALLVVAVPLLLVCGGWGLWVMLAVLGLLSSGLYAVLVARFFNEEPDQTHLSRAAAAAVDMFGALIPLGIGVLADTTSLTVAIGALAVGPFLMVVLLTATRHVRGSW